MIVMERRVGRVLTFVLNNKAGANSADGARALISKIVSERGDVARFRNLSEATDLSSLVADRGASGDIFVGGGGDGTIAAVAATLVDTNAVLGVLPMGTLNHFAKDLAIPLKLEEALQNLFTGRVAKVDVGEVNGRIFLNNSSIGFYPRIVQEREREQRRGWSKWLAFAKAAALVFRRSRTLHVELDEEDGELRSCDTSFVFIGNNRYSLAHREIGTRASLASGKLWVCVAPDAGRLALLTLAGGALLGLVGDEDLAAIEIRQTVVRMRRNHAQVATDGEVSMMQTPLRYRSRPGALRVIVPFAG